MNKPGSKEEQLRALRESRSRKPSPAAKASAVKRLADKLPHSAVAVGPAVQEHMAAGASAEEALAQILAPRAPAPAQHEEQTMRKPAAKRATAKKAARKPARKAARAPRPKPAAKRAATKKTRQARPGARPVGRPGDRGGALRAFLSEPGGHTAAEVAEYLGVKAASARSAIARLGEVVEKRDKREDDAERGVTVYAIATGAAAV